MTVILELSQISYDWTLRVSGGCKSSLWLKRVKTQQMLLQVTKNSDGHQSPSPQALTLIIYTNQHACMICHASDRILICDIRFLHASIGSNGFFFLTEV